MQQPQDQGLFTPGMFPLNPVLKSKNLVRGKRSHRARNPEKFKVTKSDEKVTGGRPEINIKITKKQLKSNFSSAFVTF